MERKYLSYSKFLEQAVFGNDEWQELRFDRVDIQKSRMRFWGSFLSALWETLSHADPMNAERVITEFNDYIIDYYKSWLLDWEKTAKEWHANDFPKLTRKLTSEYFEKRDKWEPAPRQKWYFKEWKKLIWVDNTSWDFYMEEFDTMNECFNWLSES